MELRGPRTLSPASCPRHTIGLYVGKPSPWQSPPPPTAPGSARAHPLSSAQSSCGVSLKQVVPRSSQTLLVPAGGLWSLRKRARLKVDAGSGHARTLPGASAQSGSRQPPPQTPQQASPAGAIAMEKGRLGTVEQVELGFLRLDLVFTPVKVSEGSADSVGTWGQIW